MTTREQIDAAIRDIIKTVTSTLPDGVYTDDNERRDVAAALIREIDRRTSKLLTEALSAFSLEDLLMARTAHATELAKEVTESGEAPEDHLDAAVDRFLQFINGAKKQRGTLQ